MIRSSPATGRVVAIVATAVIHLALIGLLLVSRPSLIPAPAAESLSLFTVDAADVPPPVEELPALEAEAPPPEPREESLTPPAEEAVPVTAPAPTIPLRSARPSQPEQPAVRAPRPQMASPAAAPAPRPRPASAPDSDWSSRLLAHIDRHKRYPDMVGSRRPTGTTILFFRMNRAGSILQARIETSSGSAELDRAALQTLQRAQPLPSIPTDQPDELSVSVPVEFTRR